MKLRITAVLLLFLLGLPTWVQGQETPSQQSNSSNRDKFDISAVTQLLDILDLLIRKNPDYQTTLASLAKLTPDSALQVLQPLIDKNTQDPEITAAIDKLLNTPAYQIYYIHAKNVNPEIHRTILCGLPYWAYDSPAGIADHLQELCRHTDSVRAWVNNVISRIDLNRSQEEALAWLPPGDYQLPSIRFFYDGNTDAFDMAGQVGFDLFSVVLMERPPQTRFVHLDSLGTDKIERVLAHELHHVYANRYLNPPGVKYATWQDRWRNRLIRQIIKEGVAMQCDMCQCLRRTLMEDTTIVRYWIGQLNEKLAALRADSVTEMQMQGWFNQSFDETPRMLLEEYRERVSPKSDSATFMQQNQVNRPMMVYTLGWWMVGRILEGGKNKESVIQLISDPRELFQLYDKSLTAAGSSLRVNF